MDLRIDTLFGHDPELPHDAPRDLETALLTLDAADVAHAEDAFLADFARWLRTRQPSAAERSAAIELAREALDHVGDPDGAWQGLPVERLLQRAQSCAAPAHIEHARALVSWLGERGRLSLHGQRLLGRRLAAVRASPTPAPRPIETGPQIAA
jgi:hypothetical protein